MKINTIPETQTLAELKELQDRYNIISRDVVLSDVYQRVINTQLVLQDLKDAINQTITPYAQDEIKYLYNIGYSQEEWNYRVKTMRDLMMITHDLKRLVDEIINNK